MTASALALCLKSKRPSTDGTGMDTTPTRLHHDPACALRHFAFTVDPADCPGCDELESIARRARYAVAVAEYDECIAAIRARKEGER